MLLYFDDIVLTMSSSVLLWRAMDHLSPEFQWLALALSTTFLASPSHTLLMACFGHRDNMLFICSSGATWLNVTPQWLLSTQSRLFVIDNNMLLTPHSTRVWPTPTIPHTNLDRPHLLHLASLTLHAWPTRSPSCFDQVHTLLHKGHPWHRPALGITNL